MAEVWAAAAAVVAAGASAYGTYQSGQNAKAAAGKQAPTLDIGQITKDSAMGNIQAEPDIEALIHSSNKFNQKENLSLLEKAIPGYSKIQGNLSTLAQNASANPYALPQGVADNLTRLAAERGISTGVRGQAQDFSLLRDFGVNELAYGQQNIANTQSILGTLAGLGKVSPLSPLSFYSTPGQALGAAGTNQSANQASINAQNAANQYATDNTWAGISKLAGAAATYGNSYGGGGGGGSAFNTPLPASTSSSTGNYGAFCWVAREVYGEGLDWIEFRTWMLRNAAPEFLDFYHQHGPEIASSISGDEKTKGFIRRLMDELKKR
jgi:hypothetical protein